MYDILGPRRNSFLPLLQFTVNCSQKILVIKIKKYKNQYGNK